MQDNDPNFITPPTGVSFIASEQDSSLPIMRSAGWPKRTTDAQFIVSAWKVKVATNHAAIEFSKLKFDSISNVKKGVYIINTVKTKFDITVIKKETIRSRVKCGTLMANHPGTLLPMKKVESHLLNIIGQLAEVWQPITP